MMLRKISSILWERRSFSNTFKFCRELFHVFYPIWITHDTVSSTSDKTISTNITWLSSNSKQLPCLFHLIFCFLNMHSACIKNKSSIYLMLWYKFWLLWSKLHMFFYTIISGSPSVTRIQCSNWQPILPSATYISQSHWSIICPEEKPRIGSIARVIPALRRVHVPGVP